MEDNRKKIIIFIIVCMVFPGLFPILIIGLIFYIIAKNRPIQRQTGLDKSMKPHWDQSYEENRKTDYHGVSKDVRDVKLNYTTTELYSELLNRKTDYRGVNKDLL